MFTKKEADIMIELIDIAVWEIKSGQVRTIKSKDEIKKMIKDCKEIIKKLEVISNE